MVDYGTSRDLSLVCQTETVVAPCFSLVSKELKRTPSLFVITRPAYDTWQPSLAKFLAKSNLPSFFSFGPGTCYLLSFSHAVGQNSLSIKYFARTLSPFEPKFLLNLFRPFFCNVQSNCSVGRIFRIIKSDRSEGDEDITVVCNQERILYGGRLIAAESSATTLVGYPPTAPLLHEASLEE